MDIEADCNSEWHLIRGGEVSGFMGRGGEKERGIWEKEGDEERRKKEKK